MQAVVGVDLWCGLHPWDGLQAVCLSLRITFTSISRGHGSIKELELSFEASSLVSPKECQISRSEICGLDLCKGCLLSSLTCDKSFLGLKRELSSSQVAQW